MQEESTYNLCTKIVVVIMKKISRALLMMPAMSNSIALINVMATIEIR